MDFMDVAATNIARELAGGPSVAEARYQTVQNAPLVNQVNRLSLETAREEQLAKQQQLRQAAALPAILSQAQTLADDSQRMDYLSRALLAVDPKLALEYGKEAETAKYHASEAGARVATAQTQRMKQMTDYLSNINSQESLDMFKQMAQGTPLASALPDVYDLAGMQQIKSLGQTFAKQADAAKNALIQAQTQRAYAGVAADRAVIAERQAKTRLLDQEGERVKNGLPPTPTKGTAADPFERAFAEESVKGMGKPESDRLERIVRSRLGVEEGEFTDQIAGAAEQVNNLTLQKMKEQKDKGKTVNRAAAEKEALAEVVKRYKKGTKGLLFKKNTLEETDQSSLSQRANVIIDNVNSGALPRSQGDLQLQELEAQGWDPQADGEGE